MYRQIIRVTFFFLLLLTASPARSNVFFISTPPTPSLVNTPVSFQVGYDCDNLVLDYGDGNSDTVTVGSMFTFTHVYTVPGTYNAILTGTLCLTGGNQVFATVVIESPVAPEPPVYSALSIQRMNLYFDNQQPKISVARNTRDLRAHAAILYRGSGLFQAYWEVDGRVVERVNKHLLEGDTLELSTPEYVPLPTTKVGAHRVRLVITMPAISSYSLPEAVYFVSDQIAAPTLNLLSPPQDSRIEPNQDIEFGWRSSQVVPRYRLDVIGENEQQVFSAYSAKPGYLMKAEQVSQMLRSGVDYQWRVVALDQNGGVLATSEQHLFGLAAPDWKIERQYLLVFENSLLGHALKRQLIRDYRFEVVDEFNLDSIVRSVLIVRSDLDSNSLLNKLRSIKGVLIAQPDFIYRSLDDGVEPMQNMQVVARTLNLEAIHAKKTGAQRVIAVIDSGVERRHGDLQKADIRTVNLMRDDAYRGEIHGTAVAGIIAAQRNGVGIIGLAPDSRLIAYRACRQLRSDRPAAECFSHSVAKGIDQAIRDKVELVNISFGTPAGDPLIGNLLDTGRRMSVVFVAAAGNDPHQQNMWFPASYPGVISVAGRDEGQDFPNPAIAAAARVTAPAEQIFTTVTGGRLNFLNGTSMSAAIVTGVLALAPPGRESLPRGEGFCDWVNRVLGAGSCGHP